MRFLLVLQSADNRTSNNKAACISRIQDSSEDIVAFLHQAQRSVFELRKSDAFWSAFQAFVTTAFSRPLVLNFEDVLYELARQIFEESSLVHGMAFVLVNQVLISCTYLTWANDLIDLKIFSTLDC